MAGAFLWDEKVRGALSLTAPLANVPGLPLSNLLDPQPRVRTRFPGTLASVLVDFGTAVPIDVVALIGTTASSAATFRVRLSATDPTGLAGDVWDTGTALAKTTDADNGNVIVVRATQATGRYLLVDLEDGSAAQVDIGLLVAGPLWRLSRAIGFGYREGRQVLDKRERSQATGAEFPVPALVNPRLCDFTVQLLSTTEAQGEYAAMQAALGAARDALWVPETSLARGALNDRCIWGAVNQPGQDGTLQRAVFQGWAGAWRIVERI